MYNYSMERTHRPAAVTFLWLLLLPVASLFPAPEQSGARQLRLASLEYPPYFGEALPNQGVISEIVREVYARVGYEVKITFMPWFRSWKMTREGAVDGMFTLWYREERERWFAFSDPLPPNELVLYKRRDTPIVFHHLEDLRGYRIGTHQGYAKPLRFVRAPYLKTEDATTDELNLRKVYHRRVDLIVIDRAVARYLITRKFPEYQDELEAVEPALEYESQHLVLSRRVAGYQARLADFNEGLRLITEDGTLARILEDHGF